MQQTADTHIQRHTHAVPAGYNICQDPSHIERQQKKQEEGKRREKGAKKKQKVGEL